MYNVHVYKVPSILHNLHRKDSLDGNLVGQGGSKYVQSRPGSLMILLCSSL